MGDIEIVCQPKLDIDAPDSLSAVDGLIESLIPSEGSPFASGPDSGLRWPRKTDGKRANGTRYKRLIWVGSSGPIERMPVDFFCVIPPASWGAILAIRTGPAEFSRGLVTKCGHGARSPTAGSSETVPIYVAGERLDTPEEADYFAALGLPCWCARGTDGGAARGIPGRHVAGRQGLTGI